MNESVQVPTQSRPFPGTAPLLLAWALVLALLAASALAMQPDVQGVRQVIRLTARTSLLCFVLLYVAAPLAARWPTGSTRALLQRRRALGLGLALSHGLHLAAIIAFAQLDPQTYTAARAAPAPGAVAYAFIVAMALTSSDAAVRWLGPQRWKWLHRIGTHYLWLSFLITFGKRIPLNAGYALPVALLLAALALRLWPRAPQAARSA